MTDEQIIIDGLSCDNCPESKRCQEQQTKKEYAINQVLQDIPSEYANVIDRLKQIIPSITRCDYVLEKQLKRKEQECEELHSRTASIIYSLTGGRLSYSTYTLEGCEQAYHDQLEIDVERATKELEEKLKAKEQECNKLYIQLKSDEKYHKEEENTLRKIIKNKEKRNIELYKENNKLKQTLTEIKEIAEPFCNACQEFEPEKMGRNCMYCNYGKILQKISQYKGEYNEKIR